MLSHQKLLLVASTGGHLSQLARLAQRWQVHPESLWVTFESPQSTSLLAGKRTVFVDYVKPRDALAALRSSLTIRSLVRSEPFEGAVSTGAALGLAGLLAARASGLKCLYVESVSRTDGPSLTGKVLSTSRLVELRTQHPEWSSARWPTIPSVLNDFQVVESDATPPARPSLFVTLGTIQGYPFERALEEVLGTGLVDESTVWQLGCTPNRSLPGRVYDYMSSDEFGAACSAADVVITHAGVGTVLELMDRGRMPVLLVRDPSRGEHVDSHQAQIARRLKETGLAVVPQGALCEQDIRRAAKLAVVAV